MFIYTLTDIIDDHKKCGNYGNRTDMPYADISQFALFTKKVLRNISGEYLAETRNDIDPLKSIGKPVYIEPNLTLNAWHLVSKGG